MSILRAHTGHHLTPLADDKLRCLDCAHTIVLPTLIPTSAQRGDVHPCVNAPNRCELHGDTPPCRGCAAEAKAAEGRERQIPEGRKPMPSWFRHQTGLPVQPEGE